MRQSRRPVPRREVLHFERTSGFRSRSTTQEVSGLGAVLNAVVLDG
jgi:hypothetical protein